MPVNAGPLRVLIVDDNLDAANTLAILVGLWGHEPILAHDGKSGLQKAAETHPHVIFLDIAMPGMNGYDVARSVRDDARLRDAKIVALSAFSHPDHDRRAAAAGFDHCLTKPAMPDVIERLLTAAGEPAGGPGGGSGATDYPAHADDDTAVMTPLPTQ